MWHLFSSFSRRIRLTSNSHATVPFLSKTSRRTQQAQRVVSSNALSFQKAIAYLPCLTLLPDHNKHEEHSGAQAARPCGCPAVGMPHCGHAEDVGQEDLPGPPKPRPAGVASAVAGQVDTSVADWVGPGRVPRLGCRGPVETHGPSPLCGSTQVQSFLLHFWQGMPPHMLPVLGSSTVVNIVGVCDSILYKAISGVLMPTVLQALPDRWVRCSPRLPSRRVPSMCCSCFSRIEYSHALCAGFPQQDHDYWTSKNKISYS